jgi:hypothetical protein
MQKAYRSPPPARVLGFVFSHVWASGWRPHRQWSCSSRIKKPSFAIGAPLIVYGWRKYIYRQDDEFTVSDIV